MTYNIICEQYGKVFHKDNVESELDFQKEEENDNLIDLIMESIEKKKREWIKKNIIEPPFDVFVKIKEFVVDHWIQW